MATSKAEKARQARVKSYKDYIARMEEDYEQFEKNQYERGKITEDQYIRHLEDRSIRYKRYAEQVMKIDYMTAREKYEISREYMLKSEEAYTEYFKKAQEYDKKLLKERRETAREELKESMEISEKYVSDSNYYSSWADNGDDPASAFARVDSRLSKAVFDKIITQDEYTEMLRQFGTDMFNDRIANSNRWLEHERAMNRISAEDYIAGLDRMRAYTEEFYSAGIIDHRQYTDALRSLDERVFNERKAQHREILRQAEEEKDAVDEAARAKIKLLEEEYSAKLSAMDKEDRAEELAELKAQEKIYSKSQTKEGKDRLSAIREDIERLEDEEYKVALREDLDASKERILASAEKKKARIDKNAAQAAYGLGLYYDEETGYRMLSDVNSTLQGILTEQESFSQQSTRSATEFNANLGTAMNESFKTVAERVLANFELFSSGIDTIKSKIISDIETLNSLDFSAFGIKGKAISTNITYNDYGDKNISGTTNGFSFADTVNNLIARGGKF